jgi:ABC-type phosphate/phosphonate transport system permease subunit
MDGREGVKGEAYDYVYGDSFHAWARSLPFIFVVPQALWFCFGVWSLGAVVFYAMFVSLIVHFLAYLVTGLPLFAYFWKHPDSLLWKLPNAIFAGTFIGAVVPLVLTGFASSDVGPACVLTGFYGAITAVGAWRVHKRRAELVDSF